MSVCVRASVCVCFLVCMGLGAVASSVCRSCVVQLNWLIPLSVTECDWHSDASGLAAAWGGDGERGALMLNAKGEIMLWH